MTQNAMTQNSPSVRPGPCTGFYKGLGVGMLLSAPVDAFLVVVAWVVLR